MIKNPCAKDCPGRSAECHASCKQYAEYRADRDRQIEERKMQAVINDNPNVAKIMHERALKEKRGRHR